jgi:hypothetical protein
MRVVPGSMGDKRRAKSERLAGMTRICLLILTIIAAGAHPVRAQDDEPMEFFERRIRPVLVERCYECHSGQADEVKGGLRVDSREGIRRGGDSGPAVVPEDAEASLLVEAILYKSIEMPPDGRLADEVIADFQRWIEMGAPDPRDESDAAAEAASAPIDWAAARQFWSFRAPTRHETPLASDPQVIRPIDGFIVSRLRDAGLAPNPPADRRTLIRRVSFDLTGLPPTPERVAAFVADDSPTAYDDLVAELLASPHSGERWTQLWLDVARYAEDQAHIVGDNKELFYPNAYLYRDWVIAALNADMPYDAFVREQLAADQIAPDEPERHVALGFLGLGPKYYDRNEPEVMAEEWENQVDTVTRGLLGLTAACARCHDHKFDPIPTADYYALAGVFASTEMFNRPLSDEAEKKDNGNAEDPEQAVHIVREGEPQDLAVMIRGDVNNRGPVAPRGFLHALSEGDPRQFADGSGRRELADAVTSSGAPLLARVIVNRVWGELFGQYLVGTPSNFGELGERPTHPELLDDLAVRFMEHGWSLKWLQQEIVLSATYRQSSHASERQLAIDPSNRLLGRMQRRRLPAEAWRDAILSAGGRLDDTVGGRSIDPDDAESTRRTVYSERSRFQLNAMLALFDVPDPNAHAERRVETVTPLQKMFALNSPFMVSHADALTARARRDAGEDTAARITRSWQLLFERDPDVEEMELAMTYLGADADERRWSALMQALLASDELLILD